MFSVVVSRRTFTPRTTFIAVGLKEERVETLECSLKKKCIK